VVFMKGAQVGGTECGNNWIGYVIHLAPGPMMAVAPTVEMAKRNSKQRIDPLIEESPTLSSLIAPARARDSGNTILGKEFRGGVLVMTGANSAVGLRFWMRLMATRVTLKEKAMRLHWLRLEPEPLHAEKFSSSRRQQFLDRRASSASTSKQTSDSSWSRARTASTNKSCPSNN
jgi:Phage terminase large subunit (GpA)